MITEIVLSPIKDDKMQSHIAESEVWKNAYHEDEVTEEIRAKHNKWYEYHIRFEGTKAIQVTKFMEI
jgi:hypothetical protein